MTIPVKPDLKFMLSHPVHFLSLGFGAGLLPKAPGTYGTLVAIPVYLLMTAVLNQWQYALACMAIIVSGVFLCDFTEKAMGSHDHGSIVWDEIAGYLVTMFLAPVTWWSVLAGFLLFRLFDIAKPFPVSWLDRRLPGGIGTMLDDVAAGLMAFAGLQALVWLLQRF